MSRLYVDEDSPDRETYMSLLRDSFRGIIRGLEEVSDFSSSKKKFVRLMLILDSAKVYDKEIAEMLINSIERVNEIEELDLTVLN